MAALAVRWAVAGSSSFAVAVDQEMRAVWAQRTAAPVYDALEYQLGWRELRGTGPARPGRCLRPRLLLAVARSLGARFDRALPLAAAVELLHNATLVFDDIQDAGELRRGRPALWRVVGPDQAITVGAMLQAGAHEAVWRARSAGLSLGGTLAAATELTAAMRRLGEGQSADLALREPGEPDISGYMRMCAGKTAGLTAAAAALGAIAGGRPALVPLARELGHHVGMWLQVCDDIAGIWGDAGRTGKRPRDIVDGRKTLPVLYAFLRARRQEGRAEPSSGLRRRYLGPRPRRAADAAAVLVLVERMQARAFVQAVADRHGRAALQAAAALEAKSGRPGLVAELQEMRSLLQVGPDEATATRAQ